MSASYSTLTQHPSMLANLLDYSPHGIVAYEAVRDSAQQIIDYRTIYYNQQALPIMGFSAELLEGQLLFQRQPDARRLSDDLRRVVEQGESIDQHHFDNRSGRWLESLSRPLGDGFFTTFRDIDDIKRSQQQIEEQQQLLQGVMDASNNFITYCEAVWDADGQITDFIYRLTNDFVNTLIGRPADEIVGQRMTTFFPSVKEIGLFGRYVDVVKSGQPQTFEFPYEADGYNGWYLISGTPLLKGFVLSFRDISDSKKAMQQIEEQSQLFDMVLNNVPNGLNVLETVLDEEGRLADLRYIRVSQTVVNNTGLTEEQLQAGSMVTYFPAVKESPYWKACEAALHTGQPQYFNAHYTGEGFDNYLENSVTKLSENRLIVIYTIVNDREQAARELAEQRNLLNGVLQNSQTGIFVGQTVLDAAGEIIDFRTKLYNPAAVRLSAIPAYILDTQLMGQFDPNFKTNGTFDAYKRVLTTGEPFHIQYYYEPSDIWVDLIVSQIDHDHVVGVFVDITAVKKATLQIEQQAAVLENILDGCQIPIVLLESIRNNQRRIVDFRYLIQNNANARLIGWPVAEPPQESLLTLLPKLRDEGIFDHFVEVVETGNPQRFEQYFADGHLAGWFDVSVVKQEDGILLSLNDQTRLKEALQQAEELVKDLQRSNQNLEQFAYTASHDLQEPLRKIQSFGTVLMNQYRHLLPEDAQDMLLRMQSAASRLGILVQDLLAYSRLATNQEPFEPIDLTLLMTDLESDLEVSIKEKKAQITIDKLPTVPGNPVQLRQLFQNLLTNALKFSTPDKVIRIAVTARRVNPQDVPANVPHRRSQSWVAIQVTDNGIGFDEKYQEQIFQLFERLHGRTEYAGTGLGLAICRKVAENHGGTIIAHSQLGNGATFTVFLPK